MPTSRPHPSLVSQVFELLLRDKCTTSHEGRKRFVERCNSVLTDSALTSAQTPLQTWDRSWNKPLYANQRSQGAMMVAARVRGQRLFAHYAPQHLPNDPACLQGLRAPAEKLRRVRDLGARWESLHALHMETATEAVRLIAQAGVAGSVPSVRSLLGVPGYAKGARREQTLYGALTDIRGIGPITALHLLTDLGYQVYKPDRWVVRLAAANTSCREALAPLLRHSPVDVTDGFLLKNLNLVHVAVDTLAEEFRGGMTPSGIDLGHGEQDFRAYRFTDLMVAKFGMQPEADWGLAVSGKDWSLAHPDAATREAAPLRQLAADMDIAEQLKRSKRKAQPRWAR